MKNVKDDNLKDVSYKFNSIGMELLSTKHKSYSKFCVEKSSLQKPAEDIKLKLFQEDYKKKKISLTKSSSKLKSTLYNLKEKIDNIDIFYEKQKRVNQIFLRRLLPLTKEEKEEVENIMQTEPNLPNIRLEQQQKPKVVINKTAYIHPTFLKFQQNLRDKIVFTVI